MGSEQRQATTDERMSQEASATPLLPIDDLQEVQKPSPKPVTTERRRAKTSPGRAEISCDGGKLAQKHHILSCSHPLWPSGGRNNAGRGEGKTSVSSARGWKLVTEARTETESEACRSPQNGQLDDVAKKSLTLVNEGPPNRLASGEQLQRAARSRRESCKGGGRYITTALNHRRKPRPSSPASAEIRRLSEGERLSPLTSLVVPLSASPGHPVRTGFIRLLGKIFPSFPSPLSPTSLSTVKMSQMPELNETFDVLACGFGPASLALAIALVEPSPNPTPTYSSLGGLQEALGRVSLAGDNRDAAQAPRAAEQRPLKACFIEKQEQFKWHPGMMLEGSNMQICTSSFAPAVAPFVMLVADLRHRTRFLQRFSRIWRR